MPTREPIADTMLPKEVEKPIPTRVVVTRAPLRKAPQNLNQPSTSVETQAADSATPAESVRLSPQLSALARKEQAYRQREQALKEREKALEGKLAEADKYSQLRTKLTEKDYSAAEELGLTYEEYTKYLLDRQAGEDPESERYKKLEDEIQVLKKGQEEKAEQEYEETVADYRRELSLMAKAEPQFAKVISFSDADGEGKEFTGVDIALQYIIDSWNEDETELTVEEALKDTLMFLEERAQKWSKLIGEPAKAEEVQLPPPKVGSRTLNQQMQPSGIERRPQKSLQHLPDNERYLEARRRVLERRQQGG